MPAVVGSRLLKDGSQWKWARKQAPSLRPRSAMVGPGTQNVCTALDYAWWHDTIRRQCLADYACWRRLACEKYGLLNEKAWDYDDRHRQIRWWVIYHEIEISRQQNDRFLYFSNYSSVLLSTSHLLFALSSCEWSRRPSLSRMTIALASVWSLQADALSSILILTAIIQSFLSPPHWPLATV